jgi:unsaturated rhamnogalacturonyl hydrolase
MYSETSLRFLRERSRRNPRVYQSLSCLLVLLLSPSFALRAQAPQTGEEKIRSVADFVLKSSTYRFVDTRTGKAFATTQEIPGDAQVRLECEYNDWRYWNGVLNMAMIETGEALHDTSYANFPRKNLAFAFDNYQYFEKRKKAEGKWNYPFAQRMTMEELDDCGAMGASLIEVYRRDPQPRYREYIDSAADFITSKEYRLYDSTLVRPVPVKWTIWADDLYMSVSFLSRMGELTGDSRYFDDAAKQVVNFHKHLFDQSKGLMAHCWYSDVQRQGVAFWGRANGWAIMAQVNLIDRLPKDHPMRDTLMTLLRRHILGIARWQGGEGLWHQLLDKDDSYLETSCSAMFVYAIARSVNKGYIEARYSTIALRGWEGIESKILPDGEIEGVCVGTGVADDLVFYYHRPDPKNDPHGIGAVLLAGTEVLRLPK